MLKALRNAVLLVSALAACSFTVQASARTPEPGSVERKAILDALRPSIEAELDPNIEFVVERMNVDSGWAFVQAKPQRKGGKTISGLTYYGRSEWMEMDGLRVTALLRRQNSQWNLVEKAIGATDAWYCRYSAANLVTGC